MAQHAGVSGSRLSGLPGSRGRTRFEPRAAHELLDTVATLTLASRGAGLAPATPMMLGLVPGLPLRVVELAQQFRPDVVLVRREADAHRGKVAAHVSGSDLSSLARVRGGARARARAARSACDP